MYSRSVNTRLRLMDRNGHALSQFLKRGGELTDAVILALFGNGENGGFYDPYDLTDEKLAWRRNLLLWSEDFGNSAWIKAFNTQATGNTIRAGTEEFSRVNQDMYIGNSLLTVSALIYQGTSNLARFTIRNVAGGTDDRFNIDLTTGNISSAILPNNFVHSIYTNPVDGGVFVSFNINPQGMESIRLGVGCPDADSVSTIVVTDLQIEKGSVATPYQRITDFNSDFMEAFPNHTLFQDWLGTIPVTGNMQPLGLVLDKRLGGVRGENVNRELVPSNYQSAGSGSPQMSMTGDSITVTNGSNGSTVFRDPTATLTQGILYEVLIFVDATNINLAINVPINVPLNLGLNRVLIPSTDNTSIVRIGSVSSQPVGAFYTISQFTVRPILGNHAHQPVSAARPLWQNNGGLKSFWFDGLDDFLVSVNELPSLTDPDNGFTLLVAANRTGSQAFPVGQYEAVSGKRNWNTAVSASTINYYRGFLFNGNDFIPETASILPNPINTPHILQVTNAGLGSNTFGSVTNGDETVQPAITSQNWASQPLMIGNYRNVAFFQGHIYSLIIRSTLTEEAQAEPIRQLLATRSGVTL